MKGKNIKGSLGKKPIDEKQGKKRKGPKVVSILMYSKFCKKLNLTKQIMFYSSAIKNYLVKEFINWDICSVVYLMECNCRLQYVSCRGQQLKVRIGKHICNIEKGLMTHSVTKHNKDPSNLKVMGICETAKNWRGCE